MFPSSRIRSLGNRISSFFSPDTSHKKHIPEPAPEAPYFPQFGRLPPEIRVCIFGFTLLPTSSSSVTINICPSKWEAAATQTYNSALLEATDAFRSVETHYRRVLSSGPEITDMEHVLAMTNSSGELDSYKYDGSLPAAQDSKERFLRLGADDTVILKLSRTVPRDPSRPPQSYAISPQQPLNISNARYLVMEFSLFAIWARASVDSTTPISFKGLEVLYLIDEADWDIVLPGTQTVFDELLADGAEMMWGIKEIVWVRSKRDLPQERQVGW